MLPDSFVLKEFDVCPLGDGSKVTLRPYIERWMRLFQHEEYPIVYVVLHPDESMHHLMHVKPTTSMHARHHYLNAVNALLRHVKAFRNNRRYDAVRTTWRSMANENWAPVKERMGSNMPTERQRQGLISFSEAVAARDELPYASDERILLGMYTYLPPARGGDYHALRIVQNESDDARGNSLVMTPDGCKVVLREYKTAKKHGVITMDLPTELTAEIKESLRVRPRKYLFHQVYHLDRPYTRAAFSVWSRTRMRQIFGKPTTPTIIRHAFISHTVDFNRPLKELQELATTMGHTVAEQKRYQYIV